MRSSVATFPSGASRTSYAGSGAHLATLVSRSQAIFGPIAGLSRPTRTPESRALGIWQRWEARAAGSAVLAGLADVGVRGLISLAMAGWRVVVRGAGLAT